MRLLLLQCLCSVVLCLRPSSRLPVPKASYELVAPAFQYEFSERADATFNETATAMRVCAAGFAVHALVQATTVLYVTLSEKSPVRLLGLGGCIDEAVYAWLIYVAAAHFNAIATSKGRDIENLMTGVQEQTKLWTKMQKPLFVQASLMVLGLVYQAYGLKAIAQTQSWVCGQAVACLTARLRFSLSVD